MSLGYAAPAGAAGGEGRGKLERLLSLEVSAPATNGYRFQFSAFRAQPGGASAMIQVRRESSSATYILRRPELVSKKRVKADFGELGTVSLRFKEVAGGHGSDRCGRSSFSVGRFKGKIRFDGESSFTSVRSQRRFGTIISQATRRGCKGGLPFPVPFRAPAERGSVVTSCGPDGVGLLAFELIADGPADFFVVKVERTSQLQIIRMTSLVGPSRTVAIDDRTSTARLTPPDPFAGRAFLERRKLSGNLRAPLPGVGMVELTPGDAELTAINEFSSFPRCFPPLLARPGEPELGLRDALADALAQRTLTSAVQQLFAG